MRTVMLVALLVGTFTAAGWGDVYTARYVGTPNHRHDRPHVTEFTFTVDVDTETDARWWELVGRVEEPVGIPPAPRPFTRADRRPALPVEARTFAVRACSRRVPLLDSFTGEDLERYQFRAGDEQPLEYTNRETGAALLPNFSFIELFLPRASDNPSKHETGLAGSCEYLGRVYLLVDVRPAVGAVGPWEDAKRLELDPGLLLGTSRGFRETPPGRIAGPEDYDYVPFVEQDYDRMVEAGTNYVVASGEQIAWARVRPLFYIAAPSQFPEDFYRSNYLGYRTIMDEPAIIFRGDERVGNHVRDVRDAAASLRMRARTEYDRLPSREGTSRFTFGERIAGVDADPLRLYQTDLPYWETEYSAVWYELAEGGTGIVHEGRYNLKPDAFGYETLIGQGIELATDELLLLHYAFLRGAARNFGKDWGMSIYGQADPAISPRAIELAYDLGARYIWFWTSDHDHHLPFEEQMALTAHVTERARRSPRPPRNVLICAATTVIALPDGYMVDPWNLYGFDVFRTDRPNHTGTPHAAVLRRALGEALLCLRRGEAFDFAVDAGDFRPEGYERIVRVGYDSRVREDGTARASRNRRHARGRFSLDLALVPEPPATALHTAGRPVVTAGYAGAAPPAVDGDVSDWAGAAWHDLRPNERSLEHLEGPDDLAARCALAYDGTTLYLAVDVVDDVHHQVYEDRWLWNGDSVQVGWDPLLDGGEEGYRPDDSEFGFALDDRERVNRYWWVSPAGSPAPASREFAAAVRKTERGMAYEAAIPAAALAPWRPFLADRAGLCVTVNDADDEEGRDAAVELVDALMYRKSPAHFAVLALAPPPDAMAPEYAAVVFPGRTVNRAGEPLDLSVRAFTRTARTMTLDCILTGEDGRRATGTMAWPLMPGRHAATLAVRAPGASPGFYALEVTLRESDAELDRARADILLW